MAENLMQFRERTAFVYERLRTDERFYLNAGVANKVGADRELLPFYGDTVIFDLDDDSKRWLKEVQDILYAYCDRYTLLAKKLTMESFHITLHDLTWRLPENAGELLDQLKDREQRVNILLEAFRAQYPDGVRVKATSLMNMMGTSAVLAFEPAAEEDCAALMDMYERLHAVIPIAHKLTPHVTIGYYRPDENGYGADVTQALQDAIDLVNARYRDKEIVLSVRHPHLRYSCFTDMNTYCTREDMLRALGAND